MRKVKKYLFIVAILIILYNCVDIYAISNNWINNYSISKDSNNVSYATVVSDDIPTNSYLIGSFVYTSNHVLKLKDIMYASANSFSGSDLDAVNMYYKDIYGKWYEISEGKKKVDFSNKSIKVTNIDGVKVDELNQQETIDFFIIYNILKVGDNNGIYKVFI